MKVWLDDVRPAPEGWIPIQDYDDFVNFMWTMGHDGVSQIEEMSLDHDLGANCDLCYGVVDDASQTVVQNCGGPDAIHWTSGTCLRDCRCHKTGYDAVSWMQNTGLFPPKRPTVHSMNPVGRQRMEQVIRFHYGED